MSSRQEEKEQRKAERLERERAAQSEAKRKRLLQIAGGVVVAAAIVVGLVLALAGGGGGGGDRPSEAAVKSAATAAGCVYKSFPDEGRGHVTTARTPANYKTNPPTSGDHNPNPAQDGLYPSGNEPSIANWVHTLEHGRVLLQYPADSPPATVTALTKLFQEPVKGKDASYHMALLQNNTKMPFKTAAVAWRHYVGCQSADAAAIKALRTFRDRFVDKGPELIA